MVGVPDLSLDFFLLVKSDKLLIEELQQFLEF
jgi:hypothetical protein